MLEFTDQDGKRWDVFEVFPDTLALGRAELLPSAFRTGWLVFDCGVERRRLAPFPSEWSGFSTIALQSLLDASNIVTRGTRSPRQSSNSDPGSSTSESGAP